MPELPSDVIMPEPEDPNTYCKNCGTVVELLYCPNCGQSIREVRVSFWGLMSQFFDQVFDLDSKTFRTLKPLLFKPGALTIAFMNGKRVPFVHPLRLYLFCSIAFFLSLAHFTKPVGGDVVLRGEEAQVIDPISPEKSVQTEPAQTEQPPPAEGNSPESEQSQDTESIDGTPISFSSDRFDESTWWGRAINRKLDEREAYLRHMDPKEVNRRLPMMMIDMASKVLFFMMPLFAVFLKLLYIRREPLYVDHLIFAFHYHAFLFVLYTTLIWTNEVFNGSGVLTLWMILLIIFGSPAYLLACMKRVYRQSWLKTSVKFFLLSAAHFFSVLIVLICSALLSVFAI